MLEVQKLIRLADLKVKAEIVAAPLREIFDQVTTEDVKGRHLVSFPSEFCF